MPFIRSSREPVNEAQLKAVSCLLFVVCPLSISAGVLASLQTFAGMQAARADYEIGKNEKSEPKCAEFKNSKLPDLTEMKSSGLAKNMVDALKNDEPTTWNYIGNIESMKFHRESCEFARIMAASRRVGFQFRQQAIDAGMKPCNWCQPQWWTRVEGRIIYPVTGNNDIIVSP